MKIRVLIHALVNREAAALRFIVMEATKKSDGVARPSETLVAHKQKDELRVKREEEIKRRIKKAKQEEERKAAGGRVKGTACEEKITETFDTIFDKTIGKVEKLKTVLKFDRTQKLVCVYGTGTLVFSVLLCACVIGAVVGIYMGLGKPTPDVTQLVILCLLPVFLVVVNFMLYAYYKADDDDGPWCPDCGGKSKSTKDKCNCVVVWCKLMVFFSLLVAECTVCLLPIDVANRSGLVGCGDWNLACGGLDFSVIWQILFWTLAVLAVFVIPFSISMYESQPVDPEDGFTCAEKIKGRIKRVWCSLLMQAIFAVLVTFLFFLLVNLVGTVELPLDIITQTAVADGVLDVITPFTFVAGAIKTPITSVESNFPSIFQSEKPLLMVAPFSLYLIFIMSLLGWVLFILYGGIGLWTLPLDLIMAFVQRPKFPTDDKKEIVEHIEMLKQESQVEILRLTDLGIDLKNDAKKVGLNPKSYAQARTQMKELQAGVIALEDSYDHVATLEDWKNHNPFIPYLQLAGGIASGIMSLLWVLQICIYVIPTYLGKAGVKMPTNANAPLTAPTSFLSALFGVWDYFFPLGGALHAMVHIFYLFICVWKGNIKFGLRFCGCMSVHPWKKGATPVNAMLTNILLVMMTAFPIVQFSAMSFGEWARLTDIDGACASASAFDVL